MGDSGLYVKSEASSVLDNKSRVKTVPQTQEDLDCQTEPKPQTQFPLDSDIKEAVIAPECEQLLNVTPDDVTCSAYPSQCSQSERANDDSGQRAKVRSDDPDPGSKFTADNESEAVSRGAEDDPDEGSKVRVDEPPDGGYGWVVVVCASLVFMMYGANWVMFSVYIVDFLEVFDKPQAYIGIIGSVDAAFSQITGQYIATGDIFIAPSKILILP
jgi:hypothetical protein